MENITRTKVLKIPCGKKNNIKKIETHILYVNLSWIDLIELSNFPQQLCFKFYCP